ncbi:MAG: DsrE family protein [Proteobacteria bacterium]|nr:DsrE family protein [Pseudomonadota bacterium]
MANYTFIASRDPVDGDAMVHELSRDLSSAGHDVVLFLVENGTFLARSGVCDDVKAELADAGVTMLADAFALAERGIEASGGVQGASLETLVDHLAAGRKVVWH